jgi:Photosynthetic reaction centre cytochrome C subunit
MTLRRLACFGFTIILGAGSIPFAAAQSADYDFYKTRVQPIFLKRRPGHARCVVCHSGPGNGFSLQPLTPGATDWTEEQSQRNYAVISRLVAPGDPDSSPLLMHPLAPEAGGDPFHSGGRQFESRNDPDWQTLAAWVRQKPPVEYTNLKVLKANSQLVRTMRSFNFALRSNCAFCHRSGDFASDANPMKAMARKMIEVTEMLKTNLGESNVTCYTCHRGEEIPRTAPVMRTAAP